MAAMLSISSEQPNVSVESGDNAYWEQQQSQILPTSTGSEYYGTGIAVLKLGLESDTLESRIGLRIHNSIGIGHC